MLSACFSPLAHLIILGPGRIAPVSSPGLPQRDGALARLPRLGFAGFVVGAVEIGHGKALPRGPLVMGICSQAIVAVVLIDAAVARVARGLKLTFLEEGWDGGCGCYCCGEKGGVSG